MINVHFFSVEKGDGREGVGAWSGRKEMATLLCQSCPSSDIAPRLFTVGKSSVIGYCVHK